MQAVLNTYRNHLTSDYRLISWLFVRGLAVIYISAFASMAVQIEGLIGSKGLLPIVNKLAWVDQYYAGHKFSYMPTVFWFNASDFMLKLVCYLGIGAACLLLFNIFTRTALILCYVLYLSVVKAGQDFTLFQWDALLLEVGFLAILLSWGSGLIILLLRWLLARFMFMGGIVKIASGDPTWANLTALSYHYETQPLPTAVAYYFHHFPLWIQKASVIGVFVIELVLPFFVFFPRRFRLVACFAFVALQCTIILTGNYNFFNLLVILLCLFLIEDKDVVRLFPSKLISYIQQKSIQPGQIARIFAGLWAGVVMLVCGGYLWLYHVNIPTYEALKNLIRTTSTFALVNNYGPFAVMTTTRNEIIIQGSDDNQNWSDYEFKYKPGELSKQLGWIIPHQPRLDWQMWFAALSPPKKASWFDSLLINLLQGSPSVVSLLAKNPFPEKPPVYIRALIYQYNYTSLQQRKQTGMIWQRSNARLYWPVRTLDALY